MKSVIIAAIIMACALMSGMIDINFEHHLHLPPEISARNIVTEHGTWLLGRTYDVTLAVELKNQNSVESIANILRNATDRDTVIFHISGYGGDGQAMFYLIDNIHSTKAHTIMSVEAPAYSAHAYLAVSGDELRMASYSFLMFHTLSSYGIDCSEMQGTDRTVSNVEHCQAMLDTLNYEATKLITHTDLLTVEEKVRIETGHDVYITSDDYNLRHIPVKQQEPKRFGELLLGSIR